MADDERKAGAPAPSAAPDAGGQLRSDKREEVPPSDVIVHGRGSLEEVLEVLRDIAETCSRASKTSATGGKDREFRDYSEFVSVAQRVETGQATVVLTKWFLWSGACNVMQEIWIEDKQNPDAGRNLLKEYAVAHVHHHARVAPGRPEDITAAHLESVDAINMRHILDSKVPKKTFKCHGDNPFRNTWIEPKGKTLFPPDGKKRCTQWRWKDPSSRDHNPYFFRILEEASKLDTVWVSGCGIKDRDRTVGVQATPCTLEELMNRYKLEPTRGAKDPRKCQTCECSPCHKTCPAWRDLKVAMLCMGISTYARDPLPNAERDAQALCDGLNALGPHCKVKAEVRINEDLRTRTGFNTCIRTFLQRDGLQLTPPETVLIAYSGHGGQKEGVYLLPGGVDATDCEESDLFSLGQMLTLCRVKLDRNARDKLKPVRFLVVIDACRSRMPNSFFESLEPGGEPPNDWAMLFSCLRGTPAKDGPTGGHSPFVKALLHAKEGIFAEGVPLKKGLKDAGDRLKQVGQIAFRVGSWEEIPDDL